MPWFERLQLEGRGKWKGVEFLLASSDSVAGRRTKVHTYPGRDNPYVEDMGRATREFNLTCYVVGPNYDQLRDELRIKFEEPGSGELVHPMWGQFKAQVTSPVRIRETPNEGGVARFDLRLVDVGGEAIARSELDLEPIVDTKADNVNAASRFEFEDIFKGAGAVENVRNKAISQVGSMSAKLQKLRSTQNAALSITDDEGASELSKITGTGSSTLLSDPGSLVDSIQASTAAVFSAVAVLDTATQNLIAAGGRQVALLDGRLFGDVRAQRMLDALTDAAANGDDIPPVAVFGLAAQSSQILFETANQAAIIRAFRTAAVVEAVRALVQLEYSSRDAVIDARDQALDALTDRIEDPNNSDQVWSTLLDLREVFSKSMNQIAQRLPAVSEYTPPMNLPALVVAYIVHGDALRAEELIARNKLTSPNFVTGQVAVKVLRDV